MDKATLKRYIISSFVTFLASFAAAIAPFIGDVSMKEGALIALVMTGARAGVKAVLEYVAQIKL